MRIFSFGNSFSDTENRIYRLAKWFDMAHEDTKKKSGDTNMSKNKWEAGMRLEAVDKQNPGLTCVASVSEYT